MNFLSSFTYIHRNVNNKPKAATNWATTIVVSIVTFCLVAYFPRDSFSPPNWICLFAVYLNYTYIVHKWMDWIPKMCRLRHP